LLTALSVGGALAGYLGFAPSPSVRKAERGNHVAARLGGSAAPGPVELVAGTEVAPNAMRNDLIEPNSRPDEWSERYPPVPIPPAGSPVSYGHQVVGNRDYNFVLDSGRYHVVGDRGLTGNVLVRGKVTLYVPFGSSLGFGGDQKITIVPGATLKLYVGCETASWTGNAGIDNQNISNPLTRDIASLHFQYFGLPTNKSLNLAGKADFCGVIYAPSADLSLGPGGEAAAGEQVRPEDLRRARAGRPNSHPPATLPQPTPEV
jgi:hypothetical protein